MMSAAGALDAYSSVLDVVQNNVANSSTPGYAAQSEQLNSLPFDPAIGFNGGVRAGKVVSSRNQYAEQAVQQQSTVLGQAQQDVSSLTGLQSLFDVTGSSGIATAFNNLFQAFSAWGQTPSSTVARQNVIEQAANVAGAFNQTATGLQQVAKNTIEQLQQTVGDINQIAGQIAQYNQTIMNGDRNDAGLDAQINSGLEQLSQYVPISALQQADGTYTVLLNGQSTLVAQNRVYAIGLNPIAPDPAAQYAQGPAHESVVSAQGIDLTSILTGGQIGSLLNTANVVLPSYIGDGTQAGEVNTLALQFAQRVNSLLTAGNQSDGPPPVPGVALFQYDTTNDTNAALSLQVDPSVTPGQLSAISPGPPEVSNGVPLALSQMANPTDPNDEVGGVSYAQYYGNIAASVGRNVGTATNMVQTQQSAVAQAQNVRQQLSGVSLDEEATILVQFQRAYEANSKLISVLNQLTEDTINILPNS